MSKKSDINGNAFLSKLPSELLGQVFGYLDRADPKRARGVSRMMCDASITLMRKLRFHYLEGRNVQGLITVFTTPGNSLLSEGSRHYVKKVNTRKGMAPYRLLKLLSGLQNVVYNGHGHDSESRTQSLIRLTRSLRVSHAQLRSLEFSEAEFSPTNLLELATAQPGLQSMKLRNITSNGSLSAWIDLLAHLYNHGLETLEIRNWRTEQGPLVRMPPGTRRHNFMSKPYMGQHYVVTYRDEELFLLVHGAQAVKQAVAIILGQYRPTTERFLEDLRRPDSRVF